MARSFSNTKLVSSFVIDQLSIVLSRRGFATASEGAVSGSKRGVAMSNVMLKKAGEEGNKATTSWVPDPKTGFYRPENHCSDTDPSDAAELRNKISPN